MKRNIKNITFVIYKVFRIIEIIDKLIKNIGKSYLLFFDLEKFATIINYTRSIMKKNGETFNTNGYLL
jgi:hypothetical protein